MPDDPDDAPAKFSELDLSEDTLITGDDVDAGIGTGDDDSAVTPPPDANNEDADADTEAADPGE